MGVLSAIDMSPIMVMGYPSPISTYPHLYVSAPRHVSARIAQSSAVAEGVCRADIRVTHLSTLNVYIIEDRIYILIYLRLPQFEQKLVGGASADSTIFWVNPLIKLASSLVSSMISLASLGSLAPIIKLSTSDGWSWTFMSMGGTTAPSSGLISFHLLSMILAPI